MHKPTIQSLHRQHYHFTVDEPGALLLQYSKILNQWKFVKYSCRHCGNTYKTVKHFSTCKQLNSIKRRKIEVPIQVVTKNGQRMYRYGDSGKLYADRKDAEKQAQAIMASGYREPMKDMSKKK
jgi:hypothetical protein